ncbi:hypothetical protein GCM10027589_25270 [Actinocorallia lasiicapitis]
MAPQFSADRAKMAAAAVDVDGAVSDVTGQQKNLRSEVQALEARWRGNAADSFIQRVFVDFDKAFTRTLKDLGDIHDHLVHNKAQYQKVEDQNQNEMNRLDGLLNH